MKTCSNWRGGSALGLVILALASSAGAVSVTANFDSIATASVPSGYTEGGIRFSSPTPFGVATTTFGATLMGWGGYVYSGNLLFVHNIGWVGISVPGLLMQSVSFKLGFDWSGYLIEYGLLDTSFGWQTWRNGAMTGSGGFTNTFENRSHGGGFVTVIGDDSFDTLLVRSTAVGYQGLPGTGGLLFARGPVIGYGNENNIAFDTVSVLLNSPSASPQQPASVPDGGSAALLLGIALVTLSGNHARLKHRTMHKTK
jgi:hypothetical protein